MLQLLKTFLLSNMLNMKTQPGGFDDFSGRQHKSIKLTLANWHVLLF